MKKPTEVEVLRKALEMAIAEFEFRLDCACGARDGQLADYLPFAKERAGVYTQRAKRELEGRKGK